MRALEAGNDLRRSDGLRPDRPTGEWHPQQLTGHEEGDVHVAATVLASDLHEIATKGWTRLTFAARLGKIGPRFHKLGYV